jgi:transcriptional regulatory protein LevR
MLRTSITQKQCEASKRNDLMSRFSLEHSSLEPSSIIKTMMKIIKTKSKDSMDMDTQVQFSKIADAVVRMVEEIRE